MFLGWSWEKYSDGQIKPVDVYFNLKHGLVGTVNPIYGGSGYLVDEAIKRFPRYADQIRAIATLCSN